MERKISKKVLKLCQSEFGVVFRCAQIEPVGFHVGVGLIEQAGRSIVALRHHRKVRTERWLVCSSFDVRESSGLLWIRQDVGGNQKVVFFVQFRLYSTQIKLKGVWRCQNSELFAIHNVNKV